jgi:hypothetical protein
MVCSQKCGRLETVPAMSQLKFAAMVNLFQPFAAASANIHNLPVG